MVPEDDKPPDLSVESIENPRTRCVGFAKLNLKFDALTR